MTGAPAGLFAGGGRVLRPGGELWCVNNNRRPPRAALRRCVGPTQAAAPDRLFPATFPPRR